MTTPEGNYKFRSFDRQTCANTVTTLCLAVAINLCGNIKPSTVDYGHHIGYFGVSMGLYTASIWNRGENRRVACKEIWLSYVWAGTRSIDGSIRAVSELPPLDIHHTYIMYSLACQGQFVGHKNWPRILLNWQPPDERSYPIQSNPVIDDDGLRLQTQGVILAGDGGRGTTYTSLYTYVGRFPFCQWNYAKRKFTAIAVSFFLGHEAITHVIFFSPWRGVDI